VKHGADKICRRLERSGINATAIHSNRTQSQRQRALDGFKRGEFRVLVATDIAARGIDVEGISHVINYDIPQYAEDYIHRIGRTGRATATGDAITFVARDDQQHLRGIEKYIGRRFPVKTYDGFTPPPQEVRPPRPVTAMSGPRHPMSTHPRPSGGLHAGVPSYKKRSDTRHPAYPKKKKTFEYGRKKKPARKLDAFSSDAGSGWSNY
jgi:ATP-dependent RNA helicase RhlE